MPKLSLICSLYRSEKHLAQFIQRASELLSLVQIPLELVIVANDATDTERNLLDDFAKNPAVMLIHCPRESLYASWNRGIAAAEGDFLGFWNVDDVRTIEGLHEGFRLLAGDAELVDFAFRIESSKDNRLHPAEYKPDSLSPKAGLSPFFLFRRSLYARAGGFNPNFRITGDFEWSKRDAVRQANFSSSEVVAGSFILHGDNLSGGANALEWVEFNIALLWHGGEAYLRPVEPDLMRATWDAWGHEGARIQESLKEWLWGEGAEQRFRAYQNERAAHPLIRRMRLALARRGLLKSIEWDVHHAS